MAPARLHGPCRRMHAFACQATDDTTVPLLAKGGTTTARLWTYLRDDRPFGGTAPPATLVHVSRDRGKEHPNQHLTGWQGILQADAYGGYNDLYYRQDHKPRPVVSALSWAHAAEALRTGRYRRHRTPPDPTKVAPNQRHPSRAFSNALPGSGLSASTAASATC